MRRLCLLAAALLAFGCLGGCSAGDRGREPENTVLVQVLGIDRMGTEYLLTVAGTDGAGAPVTQSVSAPSLQEAFDALPGAGEQWISLTNVTHFLLGDGVEPKEALTFILNESGMSWRADVWYAGLAAALMGEQEDGGIARLTVLEQAGVPAVTVLDALSDLAETGETAVPALVTRGGRLTAAGAVCYGAAA